MFRHSCPECGKNYDHARSLSRHLKDCLKDKDLTCPRCLKTFKTPYKLVVHKCRAKQCALCKAVFREARDLKKHMRAHDVESAKQCEVCGRQFKMVEWLKKHTCRRSSVKDRADAPAHLHLPTRIHWKRI